MTASIIITICGLLLLAYLFDVTSSRTKIPSVILLLALGWTVKQIANFFHISFPSLDEQLPDIGTIGLILIVLEGSLELEVHKSNLVMIGKSAIVALLPILLLSFGLAQAIYYYDHTISFKDSLMNAIPFSVVSSAVAISSAKNLITSQKEFITYESSLSDVFGVLLFNFVALQSQIELSSFGDFFIEILIILTISIVATIALAYLLSIIKHRVKFAPIIISIILIYYVSKIYHLPALIFILLFGLLMGNLDQLKKIKYLEKLQTQILNREIDKFRELTTEFTFLIRALFFIMFGFLINTKDLINTKSMLWAGGISISIYLIRIITLKLVRVDVKPLVYISPRGLITVLLFLSIPVHQSSVIISNSLMLQVIILTALIMMFGLMFDSSKKL